MAKLTKIFTGMEKGPEKIDANFGKLNAENAISDSGWVACAKLSNGATLYDHNKPIKRRVIDFGEFKLVSIQGEISFASTKYIPYFKTVITVPTGYTPTMSQVPLIMPATKSSTVRWQANDTCTEFIIAGATFSGNIASVSTLWLPFNYTYIV